MHRLVVAHVLLVERVHQRRHEARERRVLLDEPIANTRHGVARLDRHIELSSAKRLGDRREEQHRELHTSIVLDREPCLARPRSSGWNTAVQPPPFSLRAFAKRALDLLYPPRCVGCGRFGEILCDPCVATMRPATGQGRCPNCSAEWREPLNCPRCMSWQWLDGASAAFEMAGAARQAVHALKYLRVRAAAPLMAAPMAKLPEVRPFDVAYAVPLHPSRLRNRGFNQADLLLRELDWPLGPGVLRRVRNTKRQVGQAMQQRRANVTGAFVYDGPDLSGKVVAVVDDVVTTGATADACAAALKDAGARQVVALSFARASFDPHSGRPPRD